MNVTNKTIQLEFRKTLGFVQPCNRENLSGDQYNLVNTITEKNDEQWKCLFQTIDNIYNIDSNENKILKRFIMKYPSVFTNDDDPPSVTPFFLSYQITINL